MKKLLIPTVAAFLLAATGAVKSQTLTFDDITTFTGSSLTDDSSQLYPLIQDTNYGGFNWEQMFLMWELWMNDEHPVSGYENGVVSGEYIAWKNDNVPGFVSRGSDLFNFNSAYFTAAWTNGLNITVEGYIGGASGTLMYSETVIVDTTSPTLFQFDYVGIDTLRFESFGGTDAGLGGGGLQFAMDDFEYTVVPIPAAAWLFLSGLIGLTGMARYKTIRKYH